MKKKIYPIYLAGLFLLLTACAQYRLPGTPEETSTTIKLLVPQNFTTRGIDEDNLADEQLINNISLFFTEPSTVTVTDKFIHVGFTLSGDYQLITLSIEPADLLTKDIYAVVNYDTIANLEAITSINELTEMYTPVIDKSNNLDPLRGFCMSGSLANFDFTGGTDQVATVPLVRTCAKIRITLTFPDNSTLSTDNSFLIQEAANHTFIMENPTALLSTTDYFNFAAPTTLNRNSSDQYINTVYVYEASIAPQITFYTHINSSDEAQEFTATLPVPDRNYLYDIQVNIYEEESTRSGNGTTENHPGYTLHMLIHTYNSYGELVEEQTGKQHYP